MKNLKYLDYFWGLVVAIVAMGVFSVLFFGCQIGEADEIDDIRLCNAIYKAEGGSSATYLYGIRSVRYGSEQEARRICLNTIRNNHKRYADYGHKKHDTYLEFLASRYCPLNAKNDPTGLNKNWIKNVRYFYKGEK